MKTVNINTFAFNLSVLTSKQRDASTPFHTCYVGADAAGKKQLRSEWMLGYVAGNVFANALRKAEEAGIECTMLRSDADKLAERIISKGKSEGAKPDHVKAIDRATSDFRYHVIRPAAKRVAPSDERAPAKAATKAEATMLKAFLGVCGNKARALELLNAAK